jgi:hypothetical protein
MLKLNLSSRNYYNTLVLKVLFLDFNILCFFDIVDSLSLNFFGCMEICKGLNMVVKVLSTKYASFILNDFFYFVQPLIVLVCSNYFGGIFQLFSSNFIIEYSLQLVAFSFNFYFLNIINFSEKDFCFIYNMYDNSSFKLYFLLSKVVFFFSFFFF